MLHHRHINDPVNVLNLRDFYGLLNFVDLRHFYSLLYLMNLLNLHMFDYRNIHNPVNILNLGDLDMTLHSVDLRYLHMLHHWHINNPLNGDDLLHDLRHLIDLLLNDDLPPLDGFVDDCWLLDLECLMLVVYNCVHHILLNLRDFDDPVLDHDLGHHDDLLNHVWLGHLNNMLNGSMLDPFLLDDLSHFNNLLLH